MFYSHFDDPAILEALQANRLKWHIFKVKQRGQFSYSTDRQIPFESNSLVQEVVDFGESSSAFQKLRLLSNFFSLVSA